MSGIGGFGGNALYDPAMGGFEEVGAALAKLREAAGLSQKQLATKMGFRGSTSVSAIETGNPRATSVHRFLVALGKTPHDLAKALDELTYEVGEPPSDVRESSSPIEALAYRGADVFRELAEEVRKLRLPDRR